jgi:uncharacterized metal-binding protein YceD (DUF177 family)
LGKDVGAYGINIIGLSNKIHHFDYEIGESFFRTYGSDLLKEGNFRVDVELNKHETFIEAAFKIKGTAVLTCDRSLDPFDYPIWTEKKIMFKYGDKDEEISDEIIMINRDTATLEIGQYIYEFIALAVPIKKLHPRFRAEDLQDDETSDGKIVYSSGGNSERKDENDDIDPRWNVLKKLK